MTMDEVLAYQEAVRTIGAAWGEKFVAGVGRRAGDGVARLAGTSTLDAFRRVC